MFLAQSPMKSRVSKKTDEKLPKNWGKMADGSVFGDKKETVEMPRAWLEELLRYCECVESSQGQMRDSRVIALIGYVSSAKTILKYL